MASKKKRVENKVEKVEEVSKDTYLSLANRLLTKAKEKGYETTHLEFYSDEPMAPSLLKNLVFDDNFAKALCGVTMPNSDLDAEELHCPTHGKRADSGPLAGNAFEWGKHKAENIYCCLCGTKLELKKIDGVEKDPWMVFQRSCLNILQMEPEMVESEMIKYLNMILNAYGKPEAVAAAEGGEQAGDVPSVQEAVPAEKE